MKIKATNKTLLFVIDTGAEFSIINENICHPKWKKEVNISVTAMGNIIKINKICRIPCFREFGLGNQYCEFLEYNFHKKFDGLIGGNILDDLNAVINYPKRQLIINDTSIDFYMGEPQSVIKPETNICNLIRTDHLNLSTKELLENVIREFDNIFYKEAENLSFTNEIKHRIKTKTDTPIYSKAYRYPEIHKEEVNRQIEDMLRQGIIRHSNSPYNSPLWIVQKKLDASNKKKWRLVVDYRKLNSETIIDCFPIPNIDEIFDKLGGCTVFSTLDLAKGFYQIEMSKEGIHKTAFSTANGHYEFLRMPFGLRNAPSTFQRLMNNILNPYIGRICLVYMDDILIFSENIEEHVEHLKTILTQLTRANLKLPIDKCEFAKGEIEFLGHVINSEGLKPSQRKIDIINKIQLPTNQKQIKSFLGMTNYLQRYIKDYSKIAQHLIK